MPDETRAADNEQEQAQQRIKLFNHYYTRFRAHTDSLHFAQKNLENVDKYITGYLSVHPTEVNQTDFILKGLRLVVECRQNLRWTYVLGFHLKDGSKKDLFSHILLYSRSVSLFFFLFHSSTRFQYLQSDLEYRTELLTQLTETEPEKMNRVEMINSSELVAVVCDYL